MIRAYLKEKYMQVGENEYQELNPYVEAIGHLKHDKPNAVVRKTKTITEVVGGLQFPFLLLYYDEVDA